MTQNADERPIAIHVSPHPDDESIAVPCTLLALRDTGWRVINFAASMGRPADHERRRGELMAALDVAGFELVESSVSISRGDDLGVARKALTQELGKLVADTGAELVIGPHPRDGHHGHATVARAVRQVVWLSKRPLTWWMWSVWADLPRPTLVVECDPDRLETSMKMLEQHTGENGRNDYRAMHEAIRIVNAVRGIEKVFGFGSTPNRECGITRAELLTEITAVRHTWLVGGPRVLDLANGLQPPEWTALDDLSLLSSTRLRPLYNARALSLFARIGHPLVDFSQESGAGITDHLKRLGTLVARSAKLSARSGRVERPRESAR